MNDPNGNNINEEKWGDFLIKKFGEQILNMIETLITLSFPNANPIEAFFIGFAGMEASFIIMANQYTSMKQRYPESTIEFLQNNIKDLENKNENGGNDWPIAVYKALLNETDINLKKILLSQISNFIDNNSKSIN